MLCKTQSESDMIRNRKLRKIKIMEYVVVDVRDSDMPECACVPAFWRGGHVRRRLQATCPTRRRRASGMHDRTHNVPSGDGYAGLNVRVSYAAVHPGVEQLQWRHRPWFVPVGDEMRLRNMRHGGHRVRR